MQTAFNILVPTLKDYFKDIYSVLRDIKLRIDERFSLDHPFIYSSIDTTSIYSGYHSTITMQPLSTDPELPSSGFVLYCKLLNGLPELCFRNSTGIYQMTENGHVCYEDLYDVGDTDDLDGLIAYDKGHGEDGWRYISIAKNLCFIRTYEGE